MTSVAGASEGPLLVTVIRYTVAVPGTASVTPSVLVTARLATGVSVSMSVALASPTLVDPAGMAIVTVLINCPVAAESTVPSTV